MPCPACWRQDIVFEGTGECKGIRRFFTEIQIGIYRSLSAEGAKASPWGEAVKNL